MRLRHWPDAMFIAALLTVAFSLAWRVPARQPYGYDEADYLRAARLGFAANWLDSPSLPLGEFVRLGAGRGREAGQRTDLSEKIRASGDVLFLRHWHGPLYFYAAIAASPLMSDEAAMRRMMLGFLAAGCLLLYAGVRALLPGDAGRAGAMLSSSLFALSYANVRTAVGVVPHIAFSLICIAALLCLMKLLDSGRLRYWFAAAICLGLAAATLEVAFVLAASMAALCWHERRRTFAGWRAREWLRFSVQTVAVAGGTMALVWPAALLKLSFVKAYAFMAYLAVFRRGAWGEVGMLEAWRLRIAAAPVEWAVILAGIAAFAASRKRRLAVPAAVFGALMVLATLRVSTVTAQYGVLYLGALHLVAGLSLAPLLCRIPPLGRYAAVLAIGAAMAWSTAVQIGGMSEAPGQRGWEIIRAVRSAGLAESRLLVPQGSVPHLQFYFPGAKIRGYSDAAEAGRLASGYDALLGEDGGWKRF